MAILQHYGFRSWFVDVTADPWMALWFARWRYVDRTDVFIGRHNESEPGPAPLQHAVSSIRLAHHESADIPGVVWVFAVPCNSAQIMRLTDFMPANATRVHRQLGAGLLEDDAGGYSSVLVARISVDLPPGESAHTPDGRNLNTEYLFPGPLEDNVYASLLRMPRIVPRERVREYVSIAQDILDLPVYMNPESEQFWWLANSQRIIIGVYSECLHEDPSGVPVSVITLPITPPGGPRSRLTAANYIESFGHNSLSNETERADHDGFDWLPITEEVFTANWPSGPLLLQIPLYRDLQTLLTRDNPYPLLRGYLVNCDGSIIYVRELLEDEEGLYYSPEVQLPLPFTPIAPQGDDSWETLTAFIVGSRLGIYTSALREDEALLTQTKDRHFGFYWKFDGGVDPIGAPWKPSGKS